MVVNERVYPYFVVWDRSPMKGEIDPVSRQRSQAHCLVAFVLGILHRRAGGDVELEVVVLKIANR